MLNISYNYNTRKLFAYHSGVADVESVPVPEGELHYRALRAENRGETDELAKVFDICDSLRQRDEDCNNFDKELFGLTTNNNEVI